MEYTTAVPSYGLAMLKRCEGCSLTLYEDVAGIPTIGWGHKLEPGETYTVTTQEQADALLEKDAAVRMAAVDRLTRAALNLNQRAALLSFTYNIGLGSYSTSTLLKRLNAGDYVGAGAQFAVWNKGTVNGQRKVIRGLAIRRTWEQLVWVVPTLWAEPMPTWEDAEKRWDSTTAANPVD